MIQEMLLCSPTVKGSSKVAGQVSKVVASEQGCGEYKVVGAYPNCTWCIHPLHMVHTPTAHGVYPHCTCMGEYGSKFTPGWEASCKQIPLFPWHSEEPHQVNTKNARPRSCLHSRQINQIWLCLNNICTHL